MEQREIQTVFTLEGTEIKIEIDAAMATATEDITTQTADYTNALWTPNDLTPT